MRPSARSARSRTAHQARRRHGAHGHRHLYLQLPEPWGMLPLPITFSVGAYERSIAAVAARLGGVGTMGGPLLGWCRCTGEPDVRPSRPGRPYWLRTFGDTEAAAIRAAEEASMSDFMARVEAGGGIRAWLRVHVPQAAGAAAEA